ncbi:MAG: Sapep family Mn(2+)-dependent dipeptidase [Candidatus Fimimonas sp.]
MEAKKILENQFDQMVEALQKTVRFNTEKSAPSENAPFGKNIADCLHFVLDMCKSFGLETYNCDNFAGHADFRGSGNEVLGILGHLDVVPAKAEEWKYPPYGAEIHDGKIFARGTMDDKGPMIACLFAVKALKESGFVPTKTVRLIFGCDEESGMQCVEHYFSKMPFPNVSFSPDGDFPVINIEKGIYQFDVVCGKLPQGVTLFAGERANVVPSLCKATVSGNADVSAFANLSATTENGITTVVGTGKSAHGSTPDEGINATHNVIALLHKMYPQNETLDFLANKVCDTTGAKWGIALCDKESGKLTCNLGVLRTAEDGTLTATVDIRFPASFNCNHMLQVLKNCTPAQFEIVPQHTSDPLYVSAESHLVSTLMDVYNTTCNCNLKPLAIGGGTYSRCLPNCVAFGPLFPNEEQTIHMPNECIDLANLKLMAELYLEAIYRLAK